MCGLHEGEHVPYSDFSVRDIDASLLLSEFVFINRHFKGCYSVTEENPTVCMREDG